MLAAETIPVPCRDVVTRREPDGTLVFQVRTDEMYFLSISGGTLLSLCDGSCTIGEILELLATGDPTWASLVGRRHFEAFLQGLAQRSIVELWS